MVGVRASCCLVEGRPGWSRGCLADVPELERSRSLRHNVVSWP